MQEPTQQQLIHCPDCGAQLRIVVHRDQPVALVQGGLARGPVRRPVVRRASPLREKIYHGLYQLGRIFS
jgi:hypothetical protein